MNKEQTALQYYCHFHVAQPYSAGLAARLKGSFGKEEGAGALWKQNSDSQKGRPTSR